MFLQDTVPYGSQRARKLCPLLLFVGSVFVGFFEKMCTIKYSLLVTLLLNLAFVVWSGHRAIIVAATWLAPSVCCVLRWLYVIQSWQHFSQSLLSPFTDKKTKKVLSVCLFVCVTWSTHLLLTTCLTVLVCMCYVREAGGGVSFGVSEALGSGGSAAQALSLHGAMKRCQICAPVSPSQLFCQ